MALHTGSRRSHHTGFRRTRWLAALACLGVLAAACSGGAARPPGHGKPVTGGTATVAYAPGTQPVDILPLFPAADDTVQEIFWFVEQFWRPVYWFGNTRGQMVFNESLSLAYPPVFSNGGRTVTIRMKNWRWSDGRPVTSRDVLFWINLLRAEKANYANYVPGLIPDNIVSTSYVSPSTLTITFSKAYNRYWLLYNQLCLLFAQPQHAWDKTSVNGRIGNWDETPSGARAVFSFLNGQAKDLATYSTNPLWQVVDGPWRLSSYQPNSEVTIVPNRAYSGPVKPKLAKVEFLDFTSDAAEYTDLLSGHLSYGYVPFTDVPSEAQVRSQGYSIVPWPQAGMNYAVYNYTSPSVGALFRQLYIRQAIQHVVDQQAMIKAALYGAGVPDYGPVPAYHPAAVLDGHPLWTRQEQANPYPYSVAAATALLRQHGWQVHPRGTDVCTRPGTGPSQCGAGIRAGQRLAFSLEFPAGINQDRIEVQILATQASAAGIQIAQRPVPTSVTFQDSPCTKGSACTWQADYYYLGGWQYGVPINYPIGTLIFGCGGPYVGGYCSPQLDRIMQQAELQSGFGPLYQYENFLNRQSPVLWLPLQPYQFSAISNTLKGAVPQNLGDWITPEYWYLTSH
jgi:peptide/nickel transport system substrate-binding protein